jgi:Predicted acyltransferases
MVFIWLIFAHAKTLWVLAILWILAILIANLGFSARALQATRLTPTLFEVVFSCYCIPFCSGLLCHRFRGSLKFITWPSTLAAGAFYGVYALSTSTIVSILALTFGGCILIMVMVNAFRNCGNSSLSSSLMWLGDRSYGVYLVHAPLISTITIALLKRINPDPTTASIALILLSIAGAAAYASMELALYKKIRLGQKN